MSKNNSTKSKNSKERNDSMFSRENMQAALSEAIDSKTRESKRLKEQALLNSPLTQPTLRSATKLVHQTKYLHSAKDTPFGHLLASSLGIQIKFRH